MGHVDGLLLFLDLMGAVDADRDGGHHVAPPCAVFSSSMPPGSDTVCSWGCIFESRLDPVKQSSSRRPPIRSTGSSKRSSCSWWGASPASAPRCTTASVRSSGAGGGRRPRNLNGHGGGSDDIVQG